MEFPTALYPIPPKPEWFMRHTNNVTQPQVGTSLPDFQKMRDVEYAQYLKSHNTWLDNVRQVQSDERDRAVLRRGLEKITVARTMWMGNTVEPGTPPSRLIQQVGLPECRVVNTKKKAPPAPQLSQKPHKAELRQNRKALENATNKARAQVVAHREILVENGVEARKQVLTSVAKLKQQKPLHNAELTAAKDAAARVKQIKLGSTDYVANVIPDDGWKVVTRKLGNNLQLLSRVEQSVAGRSQTIATVHKDPGAANNVVAKNALRVPDGSRTS